ncbi:MAG TPA: DNA-directed RNA polymerase subunit alpha [Planctomycetota bacterium]|nr:DNA-directed RNA polymerase subunit alpha [Planctomycetota bacterium]HRR81384.1 DNA-directed RNA polymerase subunit alpha [Planctomycetota bacterium]HRT94777.1 DNA-directed RNA polymerase subunit alpha [Planctomycetota bacterium]
MRIRWRGFELPTRVVCERESLTGSYGKFIAEPFERGFGTTIGNSLRRVLLSSIEGAAVTSVRIEGVQHQYSTIAGVVEDVTDIILNIKQIRLRLLSEGPKVLKIERRTRGEVTAADIQADPDVEIVNPELHIATLNEDVPFIVEMGARRGRGYATAEENTKPEQEIGVIPVDSLFSPVRRVNYRAENTRVGQKTNYDRLTVEIWTDGTVSPEIGLVEASRILRKHLDPFILYFEIGRELPAEKTEKAAKRREPRQISDELSRRLGMTIEELDLSVRAQNCLESENIQTVRDLIVRTEAQLLAVRNLGKTSLQDIKNKLANLGLSLGMSIDALPAAEGEAARSES